MKTPLKMDISTDNVITPREVNYEYKLMFEERSIPPVKAEFGQGNSIAHFIAQKIGEKTKN